MSNAELLHALLALPPADRERLALEALDSLDDDLGEVCASQQEWEAAWAEEIEDRLARAEPTVSAAALIAELKGRRSVSG